MPELDGLVSPYVLVGGRSSRMGRDKAFLPWEGSTLLQNAVERVSVFGTVHLLSGDAGDLLRAAQLAPFGPLVPDLVPDSGPLGGIVAALRHAPTAWALIVPVDQPFLPAAALVRWAQQAVAGSATASWLVPPGGPEPLPLLLHRSLGAALAQAFAAGARRLLPTIVPAAGAGALPFPVDAEDWFRNLNRPEDLEKFTRPDRVD